MQMATQSPEKRIYTVTELTQSIKALLESKYPFVWVAGEVSNFRVPGSGHFYFTLKDAGSQISAVMFRAQNRNLKFLPEDGTAVVALGRLNVYEPRGVYQLVAEYLEPKGLGVLQLAFEKVKSRLAEEGLFDEAHKRPLPLLPSKIAVVTSPTGAVIRDIMIVLYRRYPKMVLQVAPVRVQGEGAEEDIIQAIQMLNERWDSDIIILARGGGSLEDLQAFNSEGVGRAIFESKIPVVSAVGHETDFTIADFTADLRAPTPSAAAEMVVPVKEEVEGRIGGMRDSLVSDMVQHIELVREKAFHLSMRLVHPRQRIGDSRLRLDDTFERMVRVFSRKVSSSRDRLGGMRGRVLRSSPMAGVTETRILLERYKESLWDRMYIWLRTRASLFNTLAGKLSALNPLAILERGYSITRSLPDYDVVREVRQVGVGDEVEVTLWKGSLGCRIERKKEDGEADL